MYVTDFQRHSSLVPPITAAQSLKSLVTLFQRVQSSLLQFGMYCHPWIPSERAEDWEALQILAHWQQCSLEPLVDILERYGWHFESSRFPATFATLTDVSLSCLLRKIAEDQERLVIEFASMRQHLSEDAKLRACLNRLLGEQWLILVELWNLEAHDGHRVSDAEQLAERLMAPLSHMQRSAAATRHKAVQVSA